MMLGWRQFRDTRYLVNEVGQVMNMRNGRKLKGNPSGCRHYYSFRINGKTVHQRRDMLVAELFVSNPHKYKNIAHINGKLDDDRYTNLVWVKGEKQYHFRRRKAWATRFSRSRARTLRRAKGLPIHESRKASTFSGEMLAAFSVAVPVAILRFVARISCTLCVMIDR